MTAVVNQGSIRLPRVPRSTWARLVSIAMLVALVLVAGAFFWPVFESAGFLVPPLIGALIVASAVCVVCDRFSLGGGEATLAHIVAGVFTLPGLMRLSESRFGLPLPAALGQLTRALVGGPAKLLTSPLPARSGQELLVAPILSAWLGLLIGWLLVRRAMVGRSLLGPLFTLVVALAFGPIRGPFFLWITAMFLGLALIYVRTSAGQAFFETSQRSRSSGRRSVRVLPGVVLAAVVATAALVGPRLPGFGGDDRFTLREYRQPPFDPADLPSPLAEYAKYLTPVRKNQLLFTATGDLPKRWRLATLTNYDGRVWSVGRADDPSGGKFRLTGARLATRPDQAASKRAETSIQLNALDEPWIPMPGQGLTIEFPRTADELRSSAKFNDESWTLVAPPGQARGVSYSVKWGAAPNPSGAEVAQVNFGAPQGALQASSSLRLIGKKSSEFTATAEKDWAKVMALKARLDLGYFSAKRAPGHSYGDLAQMLAGPESLQGNGEHYAALFGVLGRSAGIPVRVVVGFVPPAAPAQGRQQVFGRDLRAWGEVNMAGIGWVPVDLVQDPNRKPKPRQVKENVTAVELPPPPNTVPTPEPAVPLTEKSTKATKPKKLTSSGFAVPLPVVIGAGATVGPAVLFGAFVGGVAALKGLRRRRRRSRATPASSIAGAWEELLDRSAEAGAPVAKGASLRQLAAAFPSGGETDSVTQLVELSDRAAFHRSPPSEQTRDEIWRHVEALTSALAADAPRRVRLRRLGDPRPLVRRHSVL